jgi:branched-chain amino acid transport system ATP-binding protein
MLLQIDRIDCYHGSAQVLHALSLDVNKGEVLCLLGRNGAGKTTSLKAIMGLLPIAKGRIMLEGLDISKLPAHVVPRRGIGYVPQGRRLFSELTVLENLRVGMMTRNSEPLVLEKALTLFPLLRNRLQQRSGTLSGGEQQMLAMARALCISPRLLLLDEPTEGLMPSMIERIRQSVLDLKSQGVTTILVEQRVDAVLPVADRVAFVEDGNVTQVLPIHELRKNRSLVDRYVGVQV